MVEPETADEHAAEIYVVAEWPEARNIRNLSNLDENYFKNVCFSTANLPINVLDFKRFDSNIIFI